MKLLELSTVNFMPYKGNMTITFPSDADRNVMLVYGDNMRGKTSLLNALRWNFYGKALGRHSREIHLQDLVNKEAALEGDWSMESCVVFEADGHNYEFRRRATKRALVSQPSRPEDFEVVRRLKKDGMPLGDHLIDSEINRFAPEQTSRFFLFDGELLQEYESLLIDGSDQGRKIKEAIEQALGVPTLIRGREDAQTMLKTAQKQQSRDIEKMNGLERYAERQASLQAQTDTLEKDIEALDERLKGTKTERSEIDDFIDKTEAVYQAKEQMLAQQENERKNAQRQDALTIERLGLIRDAWKELLRPQLTLKREHLHEANERITTQIIERGKIENKIEQLREALKSSTCHACGQPLHQAQREQAGVELGMIEASLLGMTVDVAGMQRLSSAIRDLDRLLKPGPAEQIIAIERELARLRVEQTRHDNEIERLHDLIKGQDTAEIARQRARRDGLLVEEGRIEKDIANGKAKTEKAQKELAMISKALENVPAARAAKSTQVVRVASALERIFARSIDRLRDDLKSRVEKLASDAFRNMTTQSKYSGLRINSNYGLAILDERGHEVTVRSAGAEQIVALSLIDGLARAGRAAGPVVMDTPFGRLDLGHRANILRYLPSTTNQLVLFVHEGEVNQSGDLAPIASRIGCVYEIKEVNPRHSRIERVTQ